MTGETNPAATAPPAPHEPIEVIHPDGSPAPVPAFAIIPLPVGDPPDATGLIARADAIIKEGITTQEQYEAANEEFNNLSGHIKEVVHYWRDTKEEGNRAHKRASGAERDGCRDPKQRKLLLGDGMSAFVMRERAAERQRIAAAEKAEREAAEKRAQEEAERLEAEGKPTEAEAVLEEAIAAPPQPIVAPRPVPRAPGAASAVKTWTAKVTDMDAFLTGVTTNLAFRHFITIDQGALNRYAKETGGASPVPGVKFTEGVAMRASGGR